MKRYTTKQEGWRENECTLTVHVDCELGEAGTVRRYWAPDGGGYVREIDDQRPGILGRQVCYDLDRSGDTLWWHGSEPIVDLIRREARAALRRRASD